MFNRVWLLPQTLLSIIITIIITYSVIQPHSLQKSENNKSFHNFEQYCTGCPRSNAPPPLSLRQDKEPQMFLGSSTQLFVRNPNFAFVSPNSDGIQPEFRFVEFLRKLIPEFRWNSIRIMEWKCQIRIHRKKLTISLLRAIWVTWCGAELVFPGEDRETVKCRNLKQKTPKHWEKSTPHHTK